MKLCALLMIAMASAWPCAADTLIAARTIRSQTLLSTADVIVVSNDLPGELSRPEDVVGLEARVVLYEGRPISASDVGPAAIIERNQIVTLVFNKGPLSIATEARSLGRGGIGDAIRVMNLASRNTVSGTITPDGSVVVLNDQSALSQ